MNGKSAAYLPEVSLAGDACGVSTRRWRYPGTAVGRLRVDLAFALLTAAALLLFRPVLHKIKPYTVSYVLTWFVVFSAVSVGRFRWRRRHGE